MLDELEIDHYCQTPNPIKEVLGNMPDGNVGSVRSMIHSAMRACLGAEAVKGLHVFYAPDTHFISPIDLSNLKVEDGGDKASAETDFIASRVEIYRQARLIVAEWMREQGAQSVHLTDQVIKDSAGRLLVLEGGRVLKVGWAPFVDAPDMVAKIAFSVQPGAELPRWSNHPNLMMERIFGASPLMPLGANTTFKSTVSIARNYPDMVSLYETYHRLDDRTALRRIRDVALALDHLHDRNFVHGDVKPENIWNDLTRDRAVLMDLETVDKTNTNRARRGFYTTPKFCATNYYGDPESRNITIRPSRDVFALGLTLLETRARRIPEEDLPAYFRSLTKLSGEGRDDEVLSALERDMGDSALAGLVARMIQKDHTKRPTAMEVAGVLNLLIDSTIYGSVSRFSDAYSGGRVQVQGRAGNARSTVGYESEEPAPEYFKVPTAPGGNTTLIL